VLIKPREYTLRRFEMNLGIALKRIRSALAITQGELADLTGLSVSMVSAIEIGDRSASGETVDNLMKVLSLSREQLELIAIDDLSKFEARYRRLAEYTQHGILEIIGQQQRARRKLGVTA
jgi:transcriptional regulator with XRE-family HTH domain